MCKYIVDFGDHTEILDAKETCRLYITEINKTEYPNFDSWMWDMQRMGLVREVQGNDNNHVLSYGNRVFLYGTSEVILLPQEVRV